LFAHGEGVAVEEEVGSAMLGGMNGLCLFKGSEVVAVR